MIPHNLPEYVERGGRQVWRPPYVAQSAEIHGLVLAADATAIDELLEHDLVEPSGGAVDLRCAHPSVVVALTRIDRLASLDAPDCDRGWMSELEVSIWCLAADALTGDRLLWYLPYVFTDSGQTVATGREVYGYPKQIGYFDPSYPAELGSGGTTTVRALAIDPCSPGTEAVLHPVISVERKANSLGQGVLGSGAAGFAKLTGLWSGGVSVSAQIPFGSGPAPSLTITPANAPPPASAPAPAPWTPKRLLDTLSGRGLVGDPSQMVLDMVADPTLVFLKQFRDATCPTKACYQAIIEAPISLEPIGADYDALDPAMFSVTVADLESHPIASDLGLASGPIVPDHAFRAKIDFDIQLGDEVWRAPT